MAEGFEGNGLPFYRCMLCGTVVSIWDVKKGGCQKCGHVKIQPTKLSSFEKISQIIKHPNLWAWKIEKEWNE